MIEQIVQQQYTRLEKRGREGRRGGGMGDMPLVDNDICFAVCQGARRRMRLGGERERARGERDGQSRKEKERLACHNLWLHTPPCGACI